MAANMTSHIADHACAQCGKSLPDANFCIGCDTSTRATPPSAKFDEPSTTHTKPQHLERHPRVASVAALILTILSLPFTSTTFAQVHNSDLQFVPVTPCRVLDTRGANGPFGGPFLSGQVSRGFAIPSSACNIPANAQAYSLNVTVVPHGGLGFLTMYPCGEAVPNSSTLNSDGRVKAVGAIVPAGDSGSVCAFPTQDTDLVLDINGYFVPASTASALAFYPLTPCRLVDTRNAAGPLGGPTLAGGSTRTFPLLASSCNVPNRAQAYSLNVTAVSKAGIGFLTAWPAGQPQPAASTLNAPSSAAVANAAIVPAGTNGDISIFSTNTTDVILDVNGYFAPPGPGGLSLVPVPPCRVLDTRLPAGSTAFTGQLDVNVAASPCGVPASAQAYALNATVVPPGILGFLTLWPQGAPQPNASTLNSDGSVTSNLAIIPTSNGLVSAFASSPTHLIVDISGYFAPPTSGTLGINVIDLPVGARGNVTVTGPQGYSSTLTTSQVLQHLSLGQYVISATEITYGSSRFVPVIPVQTVTLANASPASAAVTYSTIIPLSTKKLDPAGLASLIVGTDNVTLTMTAASPVAANLVPGDVLLIDACPAAPDGLLVKITSAQLVDGNVLVTTQTANLSDAFQQLDAAFQQTLAGDQVASVVGQPGVRVLQLSHTQATTSEQINQGLVDSCSGNPVTFVEVVDVPLSSDPNDQLINVLANGSLEICPSVNVDLSISFFHLNHANLSVRVGEHSHIGLTDHTGAPLQLAKDFELAKLTYLPIPVALGPIVVNVVPKLTITLKLDGSIAGKFSLGLAQDATGTLGFNYDGSTVTPIHDFVQNFAFDPVIIEPTGQFDARATLGAQIDASILNDTISPHVQLGAFADLQVNPQGNPWWDLDLGLTSGAGLALNLGLFHPDPSFDLEVGRKRIAAAAGPFPPGVVTISGVLPANPVAAVPPQSLVVQGSGFNSSSLVTLCFAGTCNTITPGNQTPSSLTVSVTLTAGRWIAQVKNSDGATSVALSFTVSPSPSPVHIDQITPAPLFAATTAQTLTISGKGYSNGATVLLCFTSLCSTPAGGTVSTGGGEFTVQSILSSPGLWTAQISNPDKTISNQFDFSVRAQFSLSVSPFSGSASLTQFTFTGAGVSPGGTITIAITPQNGAPQLQSVTADTQGQFTYGPVTFTHVGIYQATATEQATGGSSSPISFVVGNGLIAAVSSPSVTVGSTPYVISGVGSTPSGVVLVTQTNPDGTTQLSSGSADSQGKFSFGPFTANQAGVFSAVVKDSGTGQSVTLNWKALRAVGVTATITPLVGIVNSTQFSITGGGATHGGGLSGLLTFPDNSSHAIKALADAQGNFSFGTLMESQTGTFSMNITDDTTATAAPTLTWSVNPDDKTTLKTISVFPTLFNPQFSLGLSSGPAVLGFQISSPSATPLNGTVTTTTSSNGQWLTVNGHPSTNWSGTETVSVTADATGLPAGTYTGSLTFASAGASNSPIVVPVTATVIPAVTITTTSLPDAVSGHFYRFQLQAIGGTGSGYHWSVNGPLPSGVSLDPNTGIFSGIPAAINGSTTYTLSISVQDSGGHFVAITLPIVYRAGLLQLGYSPSNFSFVVGSPFTQGNSIVIQVSGGVPPIAWTASNLPPGLSIDSSNGLISGTPTTPGNYPATVTVTDSKGEQAISTYVLPVIVIPLKISDTSNHTPPALPPGTVGQSYQQILEGISGSQSGYQWSISGSLPPGITAQQIPCGGPRCSLAVAGTPTTAGTYSASVTLTDSLGNNATANITVIINIGTPPHITSTTLNLSTIGQPYQSAFTATGGSGNLQWSLVTPLSDSALSLSAAGNITGTPSLTNDCFSGPGIFLGPGFTDPKVFQVRVTDGAGNSDTRQFCLPAYYSTPLVTSINPKVLTVDGANHTVTLSGTNFRSDAIIYLMGFPLPTNFVDNTHLAFTLTPSIGGAFGIGSGGAVLNEGTYNFHVGENYANVSNQDQTVSIYDPVPAISTAVAIINNSTSEPCRPNVSCQLMINGSGFVFRTRYTIVETGTDLISAATPGTPIPWGAVTTSSFSAPVPGTYTLIVTNPNQPGGGSATATVRFTVSQ